MTDAGQRLASRLSMLVFGAAYLAAFWWAYSGTISPNFGSENYALRRLGTLEILVSWALALLPLAWMPVRISRPSQAIYISLYVMVVGPAMLLTPHLIVSADRALVWQLALSLCFASISIIYRAPLLKVRRASLSPAGYWAIVGLLALSMYGYVQAAFGLRFRLLSFFEVYEARSEFKEGASRLLGYVFSWLANVINPLILVAAIVRRKLLLVLVALVLQFLMYSLAGSKSFLFGIVFILAGLIASARGARSYGPRFLLLAAIGVVVALGIDQLSGTLFATSYTTRRALVTPAQLSAFYFDFFSNNPPAMYGDGILRGVIEYPYDLPVVNLIGSEYFGNPTMSANANIWADGFAQFRFVGLGLVTVVLGGLLWLFDSLCYRRDKRLTILVAIIPAVSLANTAIETSLLTHGIGLTLLLLWLMPPARRPERVREAPSGATA